MEGYAEVLSAGWPGVPGEAAGWLLPALGPLADDITTAIMREVGEYAQPGDDAAARAVHRVAHEAVAGFGARVAQTAAAAASGFASGEPPETASAASMFRGLGRLLAMEGRSLGALQAALRVGARVTWQRLQEQARQGHGNPEAFALIGEAVFWYMDELAASCSAGYAEAKAELAGETSQLRRRLLDLLTSGPAPPFPAVASLAQSAGWPLPRRVAAVALTPGAVGNQGPLPPDVLADLTRRAPCLLIADPDGPGRRRQLAAVLRGWLRPVGHPGAAAPPPGRLAAVGPAVPLTGASGSLRWAVQALALARRGLVGGGSGAGEAGEIIWCEDHLPTLVLLADADLAATLSREALAPLRRLRDGQADRLARTLLAWLESAGDANAAARRLHVHPQTIRYRLRQVSELFGEALHDPDDRFRLLLALRVRGLLGG
ncbi:MAG TPA: helix-turn-helix domain-containing protein [Streptosporangiaceae bacterium]